MPQRKRPLRYFHHFAFEMLCEEVERRFKEKLPPDWTALVEVAYCPSQVVDTAAYHGYPIEEHDGVKTFTTVEEKAIFTHGVKEAALKDEWQTVSVCFAHNPDLVIEIIAFARQKLNELQYDVSQSGRVRWFLIHYTYVIKENGKLRCPGNHDFCCTDVRGKKLWDWIHVCDLQDKQIADVVFDPKTPAEVAKATTIVRQVRESLSHEYSKGRNPFNLNTIYQDDEQWLAVARRKDGKLFYLPKGKLRAKAKKAPNR
jgi:hypothetical protein